MTCWLAQFSDVPCDGRLVKAHLIPAQRIRRELTVDRSIPTVRQDGDRITSIVWDPRVWVPACGGPTGIGGHHGMFDGRKLRVPRAALPEGVEAYAAEYGLTWSLDRDYGPLEAAA